MAGGLPKVGIPKDSGGSWKVLYDLASEVTRYHFLYILLIKVVESGPAQIQAGRVIELPFQGKCVQGEKVLMAVILETSYHSEYQVKCIIEN